MLVNPPAGERCVDSRLPNCNVELEGYQGDSEHFMKVDRSHIFSEQGLFRQVKGTCGGDISFVYRDWRKSHYLIACKKLMYDSPRTEIYLAKFYNCDGTGGGNQTFPLAMACLAQTELGKYGTAIAPVELAGSPFLSYRYRTLVVLKQ